MAILDTAPALAPDVSPLVVDAADRIGEDRLGDDLAAPRGIKNGLLLSAPLWALIALVVWWALR